LPTFRRLDVSDDDDDVAGVCMTSKMRAEVYGWADIQGYL